MSQNNLIFIKIVIEEPWQLKNKINSNNKQISNNLDCRVYT